MTSEPLSASSGGSPHRTCDTHRTMGSDAGESRSWMRLIAERSARLISRSYLRA